MQAEGFVIDPMKAQTLRLGQTGAIRNILKSYAEYLTVWAERVNEGVIQRRRPPKSMLRCTDLDPFYESYLQAHLLQLLQLQLKHSRTFHLSLLRYPSPRFLSRLLP